jgi:hypothetical protein
MQRNLAKDPPADRLVQLYFIGNKWWEPPDAAPSGSGSDEIEEWDCPYPDVTE